MQYLDNVWVYFDDILALTKGNIIVHFYELKTVLVYLLMVSQKV